MWTQSRVHILNPGQSIDLQCEFHAENFSLFDNPIIWKKFQQHELFQVNILGTILAPPFSSTGRFTVSLTINPPRYRFQLTIAG